MNREDIDEETRIDLLFGGLPELEPEQWYMVHARAYVWLSAKTGRRTVELFEVEAEKSEEGLPTAPIIGPNTVQVV
jgi:hypothetical protein